MNNGLTGVHAGTTTAVCVRAGGMITELKYRVCWRTDTNTAEGHPPPSLDPVRGGGSVDASPAKAVTRVGWREGCTLAIRRATVVMVVVKARKFFVGTCWWR